MAAEPESHPMLVRLEADLYKALRRWAEAEDRSIAAQVRQVLRAAVPEEYFSEGDA